MKNNKINHTVSIAKEPNIITAWFKQLKDKTCNKIKWID